MGVPFNNSTCVEIHASMNGPPDQNVGMWLWTKGNDKAFMRGNNMGHYVLVDKKSVMRRKYWEHTWLNPVPQIHLCIPSKLIILLRIISNLGDLGRS